MVEKTAAPAPPRIRWKQGWPRTRCDATVVPASPFVGGVRVGTPEVTKGNVMADTRRLPGPNADLWDWQLHAACRGMSSSYFFHPEGERGPARARREAKAKAICSRCPALLECRRHALQVHEPYGIWGGLSESERQQILAAAP